MALIAKDSGGGGNFEPVSAGLHRAICYAVYDLGHQVFEFQGERKVLHKILVNWELPDERIDVERDDETVNLPRAISKEYTLSLHEKSNLRADLIGWRGREFTEKELEGFNLEAIIGKPCQLNVVHGKSKKSGNTYAKVVAVLTAPKDGSMKEMKAENPLVMYEIDDVIPETIPQWIADKINQSNEKKGIPDDVPEYNIPEYDPEDDIPFS
jgi:hypothetical protein